MRNTYKFHILMILISDKTLGNSLTAYINCLVKQISNRFDVMLYSMFLFTNNILI